RGSSASLSRDDTCPGDQGIGRSALHACCGAWLVSPVPGGSGLRRRREPIDESLERGEGQASRPDESRQLCQDDLRAATRIDDRRVVGICREPAGLDVSVVREGGDVGGDECGMEVQDLEAGSEECPLDGLQAEDMRKVAKEDVVLEVYRKPPD